MPEKQDPEQIILDPQNKTWRIRNTANKEIHILIAIFSSKLASYLVVLVEGYDPDPGTDRN
jgi:hypothetical protein